MPYDIPRMAKMLTLVGDLIPFGKKSLYPNSMTEGGKPYEGGRGEVLQMPGANRPPLFPSYEASKAKATDAQKYELRARAESEWKNNWALQKTYKTPEELYQMYLASKGIK